jgi:hypothetical protein
MAVGREYSAADRTSPARATTTVATTRAPAPVAGERAAGGVRLPRPAPAVARSP